MPSGVRADRSGYPGPVVLTQQSDISGSPKCRGFSSPRRGASETLLAVIYGASSAGMMDRCVQPGVGNGPLSLWLAGYGRGEPGRPPAARGRAGSRGRDGDGEGAVVSAATEPAEFEEAGEQSRRERPARCGFRSVQSRQSRASIRRERSIGAGSSPNSPRKRGPRFSELPIAASVGAQQAGVIRADRAGLGLGRSRPAPVGASCCYLAGPGSRRGRVQRAGDAEASGRSK